MNFIEFYNVIYIYKGSGFYMGLNYKAATISVPKQHGSQLHHSPYIVQIG
jgi:hypothetical protein